MTTNAYCKGAGLLASDSRWSFPDISPDFILYVDDTAFDKIEFVPDKAGFLFAGNSAVIAMWKNWIATSRDFSMQPTKNGISVCIVNEATRNFQQWHGFPLPEAWFAGTGGYHAMKCWGLNRDALKAVETAKQWDPQSGGATKFYNLNTKQHNLSISYTVKSINDALIKRGMVMYRNAGKQPHTPILDVIGSDDKIREACDKIAQGQLQASAPCPGAMSEWSPEESESFDKALREIFE